MNRITELVYKVAGLAPSPEHLPRLSELLRDPNANLDEVESIIRCDPNLTASILKWCNSALYAGAEPVETVEEAVLRMGFNAIVDLVMLLLTKDLYALPPAAAPHLGGLWDHCLLTGILTRKLAQHREGMGGVGFTAGLLHDLGKVLLIKAVPQQYSQVLEQAKQRHKASVDQEEEEFGTNHASIGAEVLGRWKLPGNVVNAIWFHHHPGLSATKHPIACCIELADSLAYAVGYGLRDQYTRHRETSWLLQELTLRPESIAEMLSEALVELRQAKAGFGQAPAGGI